MRGAAGMKRRPRASFTGMSSVCCRSQWVQLDYTLDLNHANKRNKDDILKEINSYLNVVMVPLTSPLISRYFTNISSVNPFCNQKHTHVSLEERSWGKLLGVASSWLSKSVKMSAKALETHSCRRFLQVNPKLLSPTPTPLSTKVFLQQLTLNQDFRTRRARRRGSCPLTKVLSLKETFL